MTSPHLEHSNRAKCTVKRSYAAQLDAEIEAERLNGALQQRDAAACVHPYLCLTCGHYHVGRLANTPRVRLRTMQPSERYAATNHSLQRTINRRGWRREQKRRHDGNS